MKLQGFDESSLGGGDLNALLEQISVISLDLWFVFLI